MGIGSSRIAVWLPGATAAYTLVLAGLAASGIGHSTNGSAGVPIGSGGGSSTADSYVDAP